MEQWTVQGRPGDVCMLVCTHSQLCVLGGSWGAGRGGGMEEMEGLCAQDSLASCFSWSQAETEQSMGLTGD